MCSSAEPETHKAYWGNNCITNNKWSRRESFNPNNRTTKYHHNKQEQSCRWAQTRVPVPVVKYMVSKAREIYVCIFSEMTVGLISATVFGGVGGTVLILICVAVFVLKFQSRWEEGSLWATIHSFEKTRSRMQCLSLSVASISCTTRPAIMLY